MMSRIVGWFFPEQTTLWISLLRSGLGIQLLLRTLSIRGDWLHMLDPESRRISEAILTAQSSWIPRVGWFVKAANTMGIAEPQLLNGLWWLSLLLALLLTAGLFCRASTIASWLLHLAIVKSTNIFGYGMDGFATIGLFYLAVSPLPDAMSLDWWRRKRRPRFPDLSGFLRRVLQLHLCLIYLFSGLTKSVGSGWWNGRNLWVALTRPPFDVIDPRFLAAAKSLFPIGGIAIVMIELGYAVFIWPRRTRAIWLVAVISMHIGIGVFMGMPLFGFVMIVLNVAAFAPEMIAPGSGALASRGS
jgi:hypothetical protein